MPEILYIRSRDVWIKECTKCDRVFEVEAENITAAEKAMLKHYYSRPDGVNGLFTFCKSCACDTSLKRKADKHRDDMLEEQDYKCAICATHISFEWKNAHMDHCHTTGVTRGMLCRVCNRNMVVIDDDDLLQKSIAYRDKYRENKSEF